MKNSNRVLFALISLTIVGQYATAEVIPQGDQMCYYDNCTAEPVIGTVVVGRCSMGDLFCYAQCNFTSGNFAEGQCWNGGPPNCPSAPDEEIDVTVQSNKGEWGCTNWTQVQLNAKCQSFFTPQQLCTQYTGSPNCWVPMPAPWCEG
jgi:hypothetical protein